MNTITFDRTSNWIDKSLWGNGEWQSEPDKAQWVDSATGLDCLLVRNSNIGNLCGYVGVTEKHPYFGKGYNDVDADVHGGLTFANACSENAEGHGVCHVPLPGRSDHVWWLGFDCAHCYDLSPGIRSRLPVELHSNSEIYRNVDYVVAECTKLAEQLASVS
jgi:hypothetical protein